MPQSVLDADRVLLQPLLHHRAIDVVVIAPALITRVVWRINENAIHLARIHWQQRFQRVQVVALDDEVAVEPRLAD